ncbi:MAG TPA: M4 family metallopeptidase [Pseudoduganella sp.]
MRYTTRTTIASMVMLACASLAQAGEKTVDNLTIFTNTKAASAEGVLKVNAARYGLPANLKNLELVEVKESLTAKHYYYQQMLRGLPVDRAQIVVSIGKNGDLQKIFNETRHISAKAEADAVNQLYNKSQISADEALDKGWTNMKVQHKLVTVPSTALVWVPTKNGVQLARKVSIEAEMPTGGFVQYLNAHDGSLIDSYTTSLPRTNKGGERSIAARAAAPGQVLDRKAAIEAAMAEGKASAGASKTGTTATAVTTLAASGINGSGYAFDPDPRTTLNSDALTDTSSAASFDPAYSNKTLRDLTVTSGVYKLTGPYVNIKNIEAPNTAPSTTTNGVWTAKRGNNAFDDTNVYFHLDQNQRYMQSLGFTGSKGIIERSFDVDTDGLNGDDNSHYSYGGASDYLAFGHGCVNDSEDADVILHEYGHGIQHNINSSWSGGDTGAMGEGFGDYWAASYSYSTANGKTYHPEWAFSWDGHNSCWAGRMLNRTDAKYNSSKTYGAHTSVTENGVTFQSDELWSAPLYSSMVSLIAAGKPRANIDKIILEAHFGLGSNIKMPAMATAIVNAAKTLFPSDLTYANTFQAKFEAQNILSGSTCTPVNKPETESNNTIATANAITQTCTTVSANISASSDVDYFAITIPAGKTLTATMTPNATSDYDLKLYNSAGTELASSVKGTGQADVITRANTGSTAVTWYAKVYYYSGGTGATSGTYTLKASW